MEFTVEFTKVYEYENEKLEIGHLCVLGSAAGYYIGRLCRDEDGLIFPYSRESKYFRDEKTAQGALENGFERRICVENQ